MICPSQTKNPGGQRCSECQSCADNSFCPLGSVGDASLDQYPSYIQTYVFPDSPDMNNYDDLLIQNVFTLNSSNGCLVKSPLLWTIISILLCAVVWFVMILPKLHRNCPRGELYRNRSKTFLKKVDIVSEGQRWIGGLSSFTILLLFGFTFWFAQDFLELYPIENTRKSSASCNENLRNGLYQSSLQLPLPNFDGKPWKIFEMLDKQVFTMTIDLVNTAADCSSITIQQNRPALKYIYLSPKSCSLQSDNVTRSIEFLLPSHRANIQMNILGHFFIGAIRICLNGPSEINDVNILQTLNICQLFFTVNQTLSYTSTMDIVLIKVINVTKPLKVGEETIYHGRWSPIFVEHSLSDHLLFEQDGEYLRYLSQPTTLSIQFSEQTTYLQNNQEPIIRQAELAFHSLLFCTLIIELFALTFLFSRLIIIPFVRTIIRLCRSNQTQASATPQSP